MRALRKILRVETIGFGTPYRTAVLIGRLRLHIFHRGDEDAYPHTHPWSFWTFPLTSYLEEVFDPCTGERTLNLVKAWRLHRRPIIYAHRLLGRARIGQVLEADGQRIAVPTVRPGKVVTLVWRSPHAGVDWGFWVPTQQAVDRNWKQLERIASTKVSLVDWRSYVFGDQA